VSVSPQDLERIRMRIVNAIRSKQPARFQVMEATTSGDATPGTLDVTVQLTRYDKGNAFARFMLAGLGQIHIDGTVTLRDRTKDAVLGNYEVTKTFAWGGVYGVSTTIEDVEEGFAEGVATVVMGEGAR